MEKSKALVLLSGGIDSTTCLAMAIERYEKKNVSTLNMFYGQKHQREIKAARRIADYYGVPYMEMDLPCVMQYSDCPLLAHSDREIRHESYADQLKDHGGEGTVDTYVPFKNGLFLSAAASVALSIGAGVIYYGAHADDAAGRAYPDCTPEFARSMNEAMKEGTGGKITLHAPLIDWNKARMVAEGIRLHAPYKHTWSCYEGEDKPCGACGTCIDRAAAFAANGIPDPAQCRKVRKLQ